MSDDSELERLKAKRLEEMQKNISSQSREPEAADERPGKVSYRDVLLRNLGYRGEEVLRNAEAQYPSQTRVVVHKLGQLLASGEIGEQIDGGQLLALFRSVGIGVRMDTKISIEQDGKFVPLSDKIGMGRNGEP